MEVTRLSECDFMIKLSERQIDRVIYALELLVIYTQGIEKPKRAFLNISDRKILEAKSGLIKDMLRLRATNPESHKRVKEIIDESRINAKTYFNYCEKEIVC